MSFVYLAGPYTHHDKAVEQERFEALTSLTGYLMEVSQEPLAFYSPITHGHAVVKHTPNISRMREHDFWMHQCYAMLRRARLLVVVPMPGWKESKGVNMEISWAVQHNIPWAFLDLSQCDPAMHAKFNLQPQRDQTHWQPFPHPLHEAIKHV